MTEVKNNSLNFELTKAAASRIKTILTKDPSKKFLRISILGGGCSGFQYDFSLEESMSDSDLEIAQHGVSVVIDETSTSFLKDCRLDFKTELIGAHFKIENPHAIAHCGCGVSFSI